MAFELKPGSGTLFKNDKDGNDARPDYRGEIKLESGETLRLAAWIKEGQKGKFMSLKIDQPREQSREQSFSGGRADRVSGGGGSGGYSESTRGGHREEYDLNDDIPFVRQAVHGEI